MCTPEKLWALPLYGTRPAFPVYFFLDFSVDNSYWLTEISLDSFIQSKELLDVHKYNLDRLIVLFQMIYESKYNIFLFITIFALEDRVKIQVKIGEFRRYF